MKKCKKIAVVGGGVFGCVTAWNLAKEGFSVSLFEMKEDIFMSASSINQYRLHQGYHYPRCTKTAKSSINGKKSFSKAFMPSISNEKIKNYYSISKRDSQTSAFQYKNFMDSLGLNYNETNLKILRSDSVSLTVEVDEQIFDHTILKQMNYDYLKKYNVEINLGVSVNISDLSKYDYIINCTYANSNFLLEKPSQREYQFELCEKPIVKLPKEYRNTSVVVLDGPFMCIDPLLGTNYHIMGHVVHAIHSSNTGYFPTSNNKFKKYLNNGVINKPKITNFNKYITSASEFFYGLEKSEHIGSMYTHRTVLPNKDSSDSRPTLVTRESERVFSIFSGKIGTCVDAAEVLIDQLKREGCND
jgi:hypothetical protein